jgi:hypothetical protein
MRGRFVREDTESVQERSHDDLGKRCLIIVRAETFST